MRLTEPASDHLADRSVPSPRGEQPAVPRGCLGLVAEAIVQASESREDAVNGLALICADETALVALDRFHRALEHDKDQPGAQMA